jgi:arylformamidase
LDYEAEYNNRLLVPESGEISARWRAASDAYRRTARADLDQHYGDGDRQRYDVFLAGPVGAPMVLYIHGGYWQWGDRTWHSRMAQAFNQRGVDVALPSYTLSPSASVMDIVGEIRRCLVVLWERTRRRPIVVGHSAGGHLAAAMVATDWGGIAGVPGDLVRTAVSVSGVFDLEPLVGTTINDALGLNVESAHLASPRFWPPPPPDRTFVAAVGEDESSEFRRQSREMVDHWCAAGVHAEYLECPGTNHYTVLDELTLPHSALFARVLDLVSDGGPEGGLR